VSPGNPESLDLPDFTLQAPRPENWHNGRMHTASDLTNEPGFTADQIAEFHQRGYMIVPQLAAAETVSALHMIAQEHLQKSIPPFEYEADTHYPGAPDSREASGGHTIRRLLRAQSRDYRFTDWLLQPSLRLRLQQLLDAPLVMPLAHHNCIMTKQPAHSSDTGWHQDIRYWNFHRPELINAWLALGPEGEENGCLRLIPGTHRMPFATEQFDDRLFFREDLAQNQALIREQVTAVLEPGDVLFFHARILHAATRNYAEQTKFSVVFSFRPEDNHPLPGTRSTSLPELLIPSVD